MAEWSKAADLSSVLRCRRGFKPHSRHFFLSLVLVSKNYNPAWSPSKINDISFAEVNKFFEPHIEPLNLKYIL